MESEKEKVEVEVMVSVLMVGNASQSVDVLPSVS